MTQAHTVKYLQVNSKFVPWTHMQILGLLTIKIYYAKRSSSICQNLHEYKNVIEPSSLQWRMNVSKIVQARNAPATPHKNESFGRHVLVTEFIFVSVHACLN